MKRMIVAGLVAALAALSSVPGTAQAQGVDANGTADHPLMPRVPGSFIHRADRTDFDEIALPAGPHEGRPGYAETLDVAGERFRIDYRLDDTDVSPLRIHVSYENLFESRGYEILFAGRGAEIGGRDGLGFVSGARELAVCPCSANTGTNYILARAPDEGAVIAVTTYGIAQSGGRPAIPAYTVNIVFEADIAGFDLFSPEPEPETAPEPEPAPEPEAGAEPAPPVLQDAAELEEGLIADGRVVVQAILFAFDSDAILPDSAEALQTVAGLMAERPELKLLVVGHTDGVGSFDYNLRLSLDRATAVVGWLRDRHGIAADRLRPAGAGPMSPITTNRTEEGRALNRRVELVEVID